MTAESLELALAAVGVPCSVEPHQRLAVLRPSADGPSLVEESLRARVVALATEHGFTHVALDLTDTSADRERAGAAVSGD